MKRVFLLVFLLFVSASGASAQRVTEIKGRALDETGAPVVGVLVTATSVDATNILAYTSSGSDGSFTLRSSSGFPDRIRLTARSMITKEQAKVISSSDGFVEFHLQEEVQELNEVHVQGAIIEEIGDTLNYYVEGFRTDTDRNIGDVLKKLPGIRVTASGSILFQDREISKLYIEGMDLLQGRYGLAINNLDASKVAAIQVLQNHQPIKVLSGEVLPETAAINIKLRKSALGAFFLNAQLGLGVPLWLLSNELVGMRFTSDQQNILLYKGDNSGRDIIREMTSYYGTSGGTSVNLFSPERPASPPFSSLFNNAHIGSINDLRLIGKGYTLTSNINYLYDRHHSVGKSERHITIDGGENDVIIKEELQYKLKKRELNGSFVLEKNETDFFENNRFDFFVKKNGEESSVDGYAPVIQSLTLPSFSLEDSYRRMWNTSSGRRLTLEGKVIYSSDNHSFQVNPVLFPDLSVLSSSASQKVSYKRFESDAYVAWNYSINKWSLGLRTGGLFSVYKLETDMMAGGVQVQTDSLRNDVRRLGAGFQGMVSLGYRNDRVSFTSNVPLRLQFLEVYNSASGRKQGGFYPLFEPNLTLSWQMTNRFRIMVNSLRNESYGSVLDDMTGYLMRSYRNLSRGDGTVHKSSTTRASLGLNYRNPFNSLILMATIQYQNTHREFINEVLYGGVLSTINWIRYPNDSPNVTTRAGFQYRINPLSTLVVLEGSFNKGKTMAMNQGILSEVRVVSYSLAPTFTTMINSLMIQYISSFDIGRHNIKGKADFEPILTINQSVVISYALFKGFSFNASAKHYYNNLLSPKRSFLFADLGLRYKKNKTEIRLDWTNVFGTTEYASFSYNDVTSSYSSTRLRPSELLLRVNFSIF